MAHFKAGRELLVNPVGYFLNYSRQELYARIGLRCEKMLKEGFLEEVEALMPKIATHPQVSRIIGYREAIAFLQSSRNKRAYSDFLLTFKKRSCHYAKRQFTWFRKNRDLLWIDPLKREETLNAIIDRYLQAKKIHLEAKKRLLC